MYDALVDHAKRNVWCAPQQDRQSIIRAARLTPMNGVFNRAVIGWDNYQLPEQGVRFHIYQIGQLHPYFLGLLEKTDGWATVASACNADNLIVSIYNDDGIQLPLTESWFMVTKDRNIVFAIKEQPKIKVDFNSQPVYLRFYSNAFYELPDLNNEFVFVSGGTVKTTAEILALQNKFNQYKQKPGATYCMVNGYYANDISLLTVFPGDVAEFIYDSSVYKTVDFKIGDLNQFVSVLDSTHKYLLHYPGDGRNTIDYHDDIEFFVVEKKQTGYNIGTYYHRNLDSAVRMVTHRDYSVPVNTVKNFGLANPNGTKVEELFIRMYIRESGLTRPLINELHQIKELYKLDDASIVQAMVGVNSQVPEWTASSLENSDYCKLMRANNNDITRLLVEQAYGYNSITKLFADTPSQVYQQGANGSVANLADVPYELTTDSVGYEYDADGKLLGWYKHITGGTVYQARNNNADLVEFISGDANTQIDELYGEPTCVLDPTSDYRMYVCRIENGVPTNQWTDVTGTNQYTIQNNVLTWLIDTSEYYTLVRGNRVFLAYTTQQYVDNGVLRFKLSYDQYRNGSVSHYVMQIPMGELDIFLNKHPVIEGLDYFVDFPEIVVTNKKFLINPLTDSQVLDIRFTGHCKRDFSRNTTADFGFVDKNILSVNGRYDVRDDKVLRIVVGGKLYKRSSLSFSEDNANVQVSDNNGMPYSIRDMVVPLRGSTDEDTYTLRQISQEVDARVMNYLSIKIPQKKLNGAVSIPDLYPLYSPFCARIISDLKLGIINTPKLTGQYSDSLVYEICKNYEYLLKFDPTQYENVDGRFVSIHPHLYGNVINLNVYSFRFLQRVIKLYLQNKVTLNHFVQVSNS